MTARPAPTPQPGQHGLRIGEGAPTGRERLLSVGERLYAPMAGLTPPDVLRGGFGWLDATDRDAAGVPQTLHPGADLNGGAGTGGCNADEGLDAVAPLAGVVRAALPWDGSRRGEGNHVWLELTDEVAPGPTWLHVDHLQAIAVRVGQRVAPGERLGWVGRSGGWACAHLHLELLKGPPAQGFWQWPYQWSRAQVEAAYYRPLDWWHAASAKVQGAPEEVVMAVLQDWQLKGWVLADLYQQAGVPYNPESATATAWCDELHRGVYRGRPRGEEHTIEDGVWQEFEQGVCVWKATDGAVSWNG